MNAACDAWVVGRDARGEARQTHLVAAADRQDVLQAIVTLVEEAGLTFAVAAPLDAAVAARVVSVALRERGGARGWLYVGEHASLFVIANDGVLRFCRRIDLGLDAVVQALTRPIRGAGQDGAVELDVDEARAVLREHGIPERDDVIHERRQLTGARVIPLLQPVLQRLIVELRQSLRFGLSDEDRAGLELTITGPGAALRGLDRLIDDELEVPTARDSRYEGCVWFEPTAGAGELLDAMEQRRFLRGFALLPRELDQRRRIARLRRWMWTGAAAAIVVIAVNAFTNRHRLDEARREADAYASVRDAEALQETGQRLQAALQAMSAFRAAIDQEMGRRVDFRACLHELSRLTPPSVRFTSVNFRQDASETLGTVVGFAFAPTDQPGQTELEAFIAQLRSSPLFRDPELSQVTWGEINGREGERFEATFGAIAVPPRLADAGQGAAP
jgi:Tfp pilus assembly protein PilN